MADVGQLVQSVLPIIVNVIGGLLKTSDSGMIGKLREAGAIGSAVVEAGEEFKGNPLMEGIISALQGDEGMNLLKNVDLDNINVSDVLGQVGNLDGILSAAGENAEPVKSFIVNLAERVASAAGGGLFGSGEKVSAQEQTFLADLRAQLGM
jgi:hypothetical protein